MKNATASFAISMLFIVACHITLSAQKTATWKGGTPGRKTSWHCASNWKEGRIPDEFSYVFIPNVSTSTACYPVIENGNVEILSLHCASDAFISVKPEAGITILETSCERTRTEATGLSYLSPGKPR